MAKTLSKLLAQKPSWIRVDEPVSGSADPTNQDATVLVDGTIVHNVEGVSNRTSAELWGRVKLLAEVVSRSHSDTGTHQLTDADFADNADISENRLHLDFYGKDRPTGGTYQTTQDIIDEIAHWKPHYEVTSNLSGINHASNARHRLVSQQPSGWVKTQPRLMQFQGPQSRVKIGNATETFWLDGRRFVLSEYLRGTDPAGSYLDIGDGPRRATDGLSATIAVWFEFFEHCVTDTGVVFPYGNTRYKNSSAAAGTHGLSFAHTSVVESVTPENLIDLDYNLFTKSNGKIYQIVYVIRSNAFDYGTYNNPLDDPSLRSLHDKAFTRSTSVYGAYNAGDLNSPVYATASSSSMAYPLAVIVRRNAGAYHAQINPAGCALTRTGANLTTYNDCFLYTNLAYFDDQGNQCPNYNTANYDSAADTYTLSGKTYYRSGALRNGKSGRLDGSLIDQINTTDVEVIKPIAIGDTAMISDYAISRLFAGKLSTRLTPIFYGSVSSLHRANYWQDQPIQVIGFGSSENVVFGSNNLNGVFIDRTNNGRGGLIDTVRYTWADKAAVQRTSMRFTEGDDSSESKSACLTYEKFSQTLTLNTTSLSGLPLIGTRLPILVWGNGDNVVLDNPWQGLGTSSAACKIRPSDAQAHAGQDVYMDLDLDYGPGSGLPFALYNAFNAKSAASSNYNIVERASFNAAYTLSGTLQSGSQTTTLNFPTSASTTNNYYRNMFLVVLVSTQAAIPVGTVCKITAYDAATRKATIGTALAVAPNAELQFAVSRVDPSTSHILIAAEARSLYGCARRAVVTANTSGVAALGYPVISTNKGTIVGSIVKGLAPNSTVDVTFYDDTPFQQWFTLCVKSRAISGVTGLVSAQEGTFSQLPASGTLEFVDAGQFMMTNIGSGNYPERAYMGVLPGQHFPPIDNISWVGTTNDEDLLQTAIGPAKSLSWLTVIPYAGLNFDCATRLVDIDLYGTYLALGSDSTVSFPHAGLIAVASLVRDQYGYKILFAATQDGPLDYSKPEKLRIIDLSKIIGG